MASPLRKMEFYKDGICVAYHFKNLVFEGGGVKGLAYMGALSVLSERQILTQIERVGGTSAGAINAALLALDYDSAEQLEILKTMDFNKFMDNSFGYLVDAFRLIREFGWYKGDFFRNWAGELVARKLGNGNATFQDLKQKGLRDLYIVGTNLSTGFGEIFSVEHTPSMPIADALRISMSIPLFFRSVRNSRGDSYVDGGVLDNYPVKLFDRMKYIAESDRQMNARATEYYETENARFLARFPQSSPYVYNRQTLGFRLDSSAEIGAFRDHNEPTHQKLGNFVDYAKALIGTIIDCQAHQHLHSDDWQRTIYIDTLGVSTTQFDLTEVVKQQLIASGRKHTDSYFTWFDTTTEQPVNKPKLDVALGRVS